jgi:myo-inositol-1(or 4)-monophosphatase
MKLTELEAAVLKRFRSGQSWDGRGRPENVDDWAHFGLGMALEAAARIRKIRQKSLTDDTSYKQDGTPFTRVEEDVERDLRQTLHRLVPNVTFVGEEGGGEWTEHGLVVALDPIDGTWAFINHTETFATSLSVFHNGNILLGIIVNPSTGELAYSAAGRRARLIQLSMLGEPDVGVDLPLELTGSTLLVNVQPSRLAGDLVGRLYRAWKSSDLQMVKAAGGSPLWALVEAAKGRFVYVNLWSRRPAEPYDLASGIELIRCAGGDVVDLANRPVELTGHTGPFIAGIDSCQREQMVNMVADMADAFA